MLRSYALDVRAGRVLTMTLAAGLIIGAVDVPDARAAVLEEIVVTATKRDESIQDIPISMTAFSADAIQRLGFGQSYDIAAQVPNLQFMAESSQSTPFIFLRGIGNTSFFPNSINPVAIYVDQAYVGQNLAQGFHLFDLERVEVLRGPQGTLFGRNATGGLINYVTRKPDVEDGTNGRIAVTAGDFGQFDVEAAGGTPLGDQAAARLAVSQRLGSGRFDNVTPGVGDDDYGDIDSLSLRGQISWEATDSIDLLAKLHYGDDDSDLTPIKPGYIISPFGVPNCPPGAVSGALLNGCSDPFGLGLTVDPDLNNVQYNAPSRQDLETWGGLVELQWEWPNFMITSQTAWDTADLTKLEDDDGNSASALHLTYLLDADWWSQEVRAVSTTEGPLQWLVGFNYYSDDLDSVLNFTATDLPPPPGFPVPLGVSQQLMQETKSWAVFGELTWDFRPDWTLRLGLRLTDDERDVDIGTFGYNAGAVEPLAPVPLSDAQAAFLAPFIPATQLNDDWSEWSGRAAVDWKFADDQMMYAGVSRGFKGGEFNGGALLAVEEATIADPEILYNYEIGYKGTLVNQTLRLNVTGFFMDYEDQQVLITSPTPFGILPNLQNAGTSEIKGFEFDLSWQPVESWLFQLGGGYLDAEFTEFLDPTIGVDRSGNKLPHAPEWNFNGVVRYEYPVADGVIGAQLDWWWLDEQFFTVENTPALREDSHGEVNARVSYTGWNDRVELALFLQNLTDEEYAVTGFDTSGAGFGAVQFVINQPRTFGGQVILNF
jgi:iron complex outermembrane receptor protein